MKFRQNNQFSGIADTLAGSSAQINEGLRAYMLRVYNYMAVALALTGVVAFGASTSETLMQTIYGTPLRYVVMFAPLGVVFFLSYKLQSLSAQAAQVWFWAFAGIMGLSLSYIFLAYTGESVALTFFVTSAAFAGLSLVGYTTKKDLSGMGTFLIMGVIGLIIASVVNLFLASSSLHFAISALGVLIFAGLTAYDTQRIKHTYLAFGHNEKLAIMGALSLYIDFINLFIHLLQFMGERR